jgi:hypothetical protein
MDAALEAARKASNHALAALITNDRRGLDVFIDESAGTGILPLAADYIKLLGLRYASQVQTQETAPVPKKGTKVQAKGKTRNRKYLINKTTVPILFGR